MPKINYRKAPQEVIDWVNQGRIILGWRTLKDLRNGSRLSTENCPIAMSLSDYEIKVHATKCTIAMYKNHYAGYERIAVINTPDFVEKFMTEFDDYMYPKYDILDRYAR